MLCRLSPTLLAIVDSMILDSDFKVSADGSMGENEQVFLPGKHVKCELL